MFELSVGSKVFILGEYQVLQRGQALLVSLEPRFRMIINKGQGNYKGFVPESPAGRFVSLEKEFFKEWDLEFVDPHGGRGGFGASTAQAALVQGFRWGLEHYHSQAQFDFDLRELHKTYLDLAKLEKGVQPSGADFLSQFQGGFTEVDFGLARIEKRSWIFSPLQILFFATGTKLATHEHLQSIGTLPLEDLKKAYGVAQTSLMSGDAEGFVRGLKGYRQELQRRGWEAPSTTELLERIEEIPGVLAAKGCGAMGADVLAVVVRQETEIQVRKSIESMGLRFAGSLDERTEGFAWKWVPRAEYTC